MPIQVWTTGELVNAYIGEYTEWRQSWIYTKNWLISISSDWSNWITIADKNLWATQVYNYGDTLSNANCGNVYQWGNNYGFTWSGGFTTTTTKPNAGSYWPWNYYSGSSFVNTSSYDDNDWSSVHNDDLWGDTTDTLVARQWPCASGYHIPTKAEFGTLMSTMTALGISTSQGNKYSEYLKIPYGGYYRYTVEKLSSWTAGYLASSSHAISNYNIDNAYWDLEVKSSWVSNEDKSARASAMSIRPFKNTQEVPDSTRTVIYQLS